MSLLMEESLAAESAFFASLLVLWAASLLVEVAAEGFCASAGFAGVVAWAIMCGVVEVSDCGVVLVLGAASGVVLLGVAVLSGVVVVVVVDFVVVEVLLASGVLLVLAALPLWP